MASTTTTTTTTTTLLYSSFPSTKHALKHSPASYIPPRTRPHTRTRTWIVSSAAGNESMLGDYGARDPFPEELESNFGEKVLGFMSTEHKILIPNTSALSLSQQTCTSLSPNQPPMTAEEAKQMLFKVVGWRLVEENDVEKGKMVMKLRCLWKIRDYKCGVELIRRIVDVCEECGHYVVLHLERNNQVRAELWSEEINGLSFNDFIVAAKIDEVNVSDLIPRKRVWA